MTENVSSQRVSNFQNAAVSIGGVGFVVLIAFQLVANWQWSLLMDDVGYISHMPKVNDVLMAFRNEVANYWHMGRFYPLKLLANILKFHCLPLRPALFHWVNLGVLTLTIGLTSLAASRVGHKLETRKGFPWFLCVASLAIAQRPLLDVIALNTIAEGWVILFLGLGLLFYRRSALISRLAWILCALSKEPAVVVFAASAVAECHAAIMGVRQRWVAALRCALDVALFVVLVLIVRQAKNSGAYLAGYSVLSYANLKPFIVGLIKCGIGLVPLVVLIGSSRSITLGTNLVKQLIPEELLAILFGFAYLLLVTPRGTAGYLLIPVSYSFLAGALIRLRSMPELLPRQAVTWSVVLLTLVMASSLWRYTRYVNAINESSIALRLLTLSSSPRVVVVNGMEAADSVTQIAQQSGAPVRGVFFTAADQFNRLVQTETGEVVLFELSSYFGPFSDAFLQAARPSMGWRTVVQERFYRVYLR